MAFATVGGSLRIIPNGEQRWRETREWRPPDGRYEVAGSTRNKERRIIARRKEILSKSKKGIKQNKKGKSRIPLNYNEAV